MPGASLVRFVTLAALIFSVALALWLLDVHRAWIAVGVVVAWLAVPLIEWNASRRFRAPGRPADEPKTRAFRLFGLRATLRAAPKKATTFDPAPTVRGPAASSTEPVVRSFLLLYRRRFAAPDGLQPVEFDGLVPRSFPGLIAEREDT